MNVVKEINSINDRELELGLGGASWHDQYKDSAYVFAGGLPYGLTEGDLITIFSQYGEIMDVNMPRDKTTGKTKGFGFVMYEDQRSTVLAVDNLNGAQIIDRTIRVDHVRDYKQPKEKGEDGEMRDREEQSLNAKPELIVDDGNESDDSDVSSAPSIDPEDPMRDYLLAKRKEAKAEKKGKKSKKRKHDNETPEERRARKERKRAKKEKRAGPSSKSGSGSGKTREAGEARERGGGSSSSRREERRRSPVPRLDRNGDARMRAGSRSRSPARSSNHRSDRDRW
ncbi:hypothetical protein BOTBODRAFT_148801 [Botryobasidium botryosum FD-172 SS1]|uniref:RRM domain-containing protein n=1 Tax=Botryobasidium botryosum (strain FD-172 SS1) TaxID=930990 RepID=A0A067M8U0_BOTB1|nr:hypothetical protein BOTBODRAFT_148801 [Botryobasidium botryosum FD-172 SS1]